MAWKGPGFGYTLAQGGGGGGGIALDLVAYVVTDIAALRASTWSTRPRVVHVTQNWRAGDRGGVFVWQPLSVVADDGGIVIKETATATGRWVRSFDVLSASFWDIANDGTTVNRAALLAAIAWASAIGAELRFSAGRYRLDASAGTYVLENVTITGEGVLDGAGYGAPHTDRGTVFEIVGTTNSPFTIRRGASFRGVAFFYPDQPNSATPVVYPPTLIADVSAGPIQFIRIKECVCFNAFDFFVSNDTTGAIGHVEITNSFIFAFRWDIVLANNLEHFSVVDNNFTYGFWTDATVNGAAKYKRENGVNIRYVRGDGIDVRGNLFFGSKWGILGTGGSVVLSVISGNKFDQVLFCIVFQSPSGSIGQSTITGNTFLAFNANDAALDGNAIWLNFSAATDKVTIDGNYFGQARSNHIVVAGTQGGTVVLGDNVYELAGFQRASGLYASIVLDCANKDIIISGGSILCGNTDFADGILCYAARTLQVSSIQIDSARIGLNVISATTVRTAAVGTRGSRAAGKSIVGVTGACEDVGSTWDAPGGYTTKPVLFSGSCGTKTFNSTSETDIAAWTEVFDFSSNFDPTTGIFTVPKAGPYRFDLMLFHDNTAVVGDRFTFTLRCSAGISPIFTYVVQRADFNSIFFSSVLNLAAGTTVKWTVTRNAGTGSFVLLNDGSANRCAGAWIG